MNSLLRLSVRNLVEYTLRSGDLDLTTFGSVNALDAIRIHQKIQASRGSGYQSEMPVRFEVETGDGVLEIVGRLDGLFTGADGPVVEEIKTTRKSVEDIQKADNPTHWGQLKCYAYMVAVQQNVSAIGTQLTYFHVDTQQIFEDRRFFDIAVLKVFFEDLVRQYLAWIQKILNWRLMRDESISGLSFPFKKIRPGQSEIMEGVLETMHQAEHLFIQAPTGIGKTLAVLYPAIRKLGEGDLSRIFFLTARNTGKTAAEDTLNLLREKGLRIKSVSLTAKEKICFNPEKMCNGKECRFAHGFYDRINEAIWDCFQADRFELKHIETAALKHEVCPFEFSLEMAQWSEILICDYNYVFDPRVYLRRFFQDPDPDMVFLVDEAHNLVDRSRSMFSAEFSEKKCRSLKKQMGRRLPKITRSLRQMLHVFTESHEKMLESPDGFAEPDPPFDLLDHLRGFCRVTEKWLAENKTTDFRQDLLQCYFDARAFLQISERFDDSYATCYTVIRNSVSIRLFCMDASRHLIEPLGRCRSTVFFSGTLSPMHFFKTSFGCNSETRELILPSPFDPDNLHVLIAGRLSTLFRHREHSRQAVADMIHTLIQHKKGNYLCYFPSYAYMKLVYTCFTATYPEVPNIVQTAGMSEFERNAYLEAFQNQGPDCILGFAVLGGLFAESIDLVGDRLTGVAIVSVGLPALSLENQLIRHYFDSKLMPGFSFAYEFPGMVKVNQAAGRVIRTETDQGVVLLIGNRFLTQPYHQLMPEFWNPVYLKDTTACSEHLSNFWDNK